MDILLSFLNFINIADILSNPFYDFSVFSAINYENNYSTMAPKLFWPILFFIHPTISPLLFTYHIPSHPIIRKSISSFFIFVISGSAVIICYYGDKFLLFLYYKSPIARERFRLPLIRPSSTEPPAFSILAFYVLSSGLWSRLSSFASPFKLQTTDLESPSWRKVYLNFNGVTCVGHIDVIRSNKTHIRSASSLALFLMFWSIFLLPHLLHNFGNFSFPLIRL